MDIKYKSSLRSLFIRYIIYFCVATILVGVLDFFLFSLLIATNCILPANYFQNQIEDRRDMIKNADKVTISMIPEDCPYGIYDLSGKMIAGNFSEKEAKNAWTAMIKKQVNVLDGHFYTVIHRKSDVCIIEYSLVAQYRNRILRKFLINPEVMMFVTFFALFILEVLLLASRFGHVFSREMKKLTLIADQVKKQDLDFESGHSSIREIDNVIDSLSQMKNALKTSLEKQWGMEKTRKNQISALAHDIKTPLTIIKGNAELVKEICQDDEQKKFNDYILAGANDMEHYLKILMDMTKSEDSMAFHPARIQTERFFEKIVEQTKALLSEKNIELINRQEILPDYFYADEELLYRALMNVITNAAEYSEKNGRLLIHVKEENEKLQIAIADSGKGFSKEDLESATDQFYRGDKSRNSKNHYGIGLSITKSFISLHGGTVELSNSKELGGAEITIKMPLK